MSERFTEDPSAIQHSLKVISTFVDHIKFDNLKELLELVASIKIQGHQVKSVYAMWTSCVGSFMEKMGAYDFF